MNSSRIRDLRKAEGWTQERLADSSGVAVRTIQRIEAGDEGSLETLTALARTLAVPVKDLFTTADDDRVAAIARLDRHSTDHREAEIQRQQQHPVRTDDEDDDRTRRGVPGRRDPRMSVRLQWTIVIGVAGLLVGALLMLAYSFAGPATGTVRVVIGAGSTQRLVDVALIDAEGQEYAGNNRGAGESEELPLIPAGRIQVNVGLCSVPAVVHPGRTTTVRFDPVECIR